MKILGLSAFYHDSAAALVVDGEIIAAAQEERFTRIKHDSAFPTHAVQFCFDYGKCEIENIDYVVFYDKPLLKFDRLIETYVSYAPRGYKSFIKAIPVWMKEKMRLRHQIKEVLGKIKNPIVFTEHHQSHAASAFFPSPYDETAVITVDGVGEWATASIGKGSGSELSLLQTEKFYRKEFLIIYGYNPPQGMPGGTRGSFVCLVSIVKKQTSHQRKRLSKRKFIGSSIYK